MLSISGSGSSGFLSLKIFIYFNHHDTLPIITMSALDKNLTFTQHVLEKMEATLSVGLLEKEAAFAVAERMVALLVCYLYLSLLLYC
jgi:hypothetical protein